MINDKVAVIVGGLHQHRYFSRVAFGRFGRHPFRLSKVPLKIYVSYYGLGIPKNSPLYELFMPIAWRLQEADIVQHLVRSSYYFWNPDPAMVTPVKPLALSHLLFGVIPYLVGLSLASTAFIGERLCGPKKQHNIFEMYDMRLNN